MTTKKTLILSTAIATLLSALAVSTTQAAVISWGPGAQNITGASDVLNASNGGLPVLVGAFNVGDGTLIDFNNNLIYNSVPSTAVNGVTFQPFVVNSAAGPTNTASNGNFTLTVGNVGIPILTGDVFESNNGLLPFGSPANPFASLSPEYKTLLQSATAVSTFTGNPSTFGLTMGGLTPGLAYQFQWWANTSNGLTNANGQPIVGSQLHSATTAGGIPVILDDNDSIGGAATGGPGGLGQYATGTFTADSPSQQVTFSSVGAGNQFAMVNAFQLRAVPEPSTVLFGLALFGVCFGGRRRPSQESSKE